MKSHGRITNYDIETARRAYANAVLANQRESVQAAREWLEFCLRAKGER